MAEDPWATTSGLFTDFTGTIEEAFFGTDARYNNGETTLITFRIGGHGLQVKSDDGLIDQWYPCGSGWASYDGGETIEHAEGKTNLHANSVYGNVLNKAIELGAGPALKANGPDPLHANIWVGLTFRFEEVTIKYGGEIGDKKRTMPVEYFPNGIPAEGEGSTADDDLSGFKDELTALAQSSEDAESFTTSAMALTGITDHANIVGQIADGSLYESLR